MGPVPDDERDSEQRYPFVTEVPTRWNDNDQYGHVNNTVHYAVMDTVINDWLQAHGFDPAGDVVDLVPETGCRYLAEIAYPDPFVVGLRVERLGRTSVTWGVEMRRGSDGQVVAVGRFVHVFVDRQSRRPVEIPAGLRAAMAGIAAPEPGS